MFTDFGFLSIPFHEKTQRVRSLFSDVAKNYDLMNDLMSLGAHRQWKNYFVQQLPVKQNATVLDVAGGTGDIALKILARFPFLTPHVCVYDLTAAMMEQGRAKAINAGIISIDWCCGQAESLPLPDHAMDLYTISFGLRNVTDRAAALHEARRVLKKGGWFYCLEFSHPTSLILQKAYDLYSFNLLPFLGEHVAQDRAAYQYLVESIRRFPQQQALADDMRAAGFINVAYENLSGGIVCIHKGRKE